MNQKEVKKMNKCVCLYIKGKTYRPKFLDKQLEVAHWETFILNINVNVNVNRVIGYHYQYPHVATHTYFNLCVKSSQQSP